MGKASASTTPQNNGTFGALAAGGLAGGLGSAGGVTVSTCPPEDTSFYCKFVKGFNIFKMILFILAIFVVLYFLYKIFVSKSSTKAFRSRK